MKHTTRVPSLLVLALTFTTWWAPLTRAETPSTPQTSKLTFSEEVIAGGPSDFLEARHITLRGSNFEIGKKLAEIAKERQHCTLRAATDLHRVHAQREYFKRNYSAHYERMRGVAAAFGVSVDDDRHVVSELLYGFAMPGCSVVYYPPQFTSSGIGVFSRDYDFTTGTIMGLIPGPGETPCTSRPYVVEMYPDGGYASIAIVAYDLLGALDGMNSAGLTIALLADDEISDLGKSDPAPSVQAGLEVLEVSRFLLDTCADVDEAKEALLGAKLYYSIIPCHYIVADAKGRSFIWENATSMHYGHIIDGNGKPQITTNFMQHLHPETNSTPLDQSLKVCPRYDNLRKRIAAVDGKFTLDSIKQASGSVMAVRPPPARPRAAARTLWHALYYPEQRRMEVDFYLGDGAGGESGSVPAIRRSGYKEFKLDATTTVRK